MPVSATLVGTAGARATISASCVLAQDPQGDDVLAQAPALGTLALERPGEIGDSDEPAPDEDFFEAHGGLRFPDCVHRLFQNSGAERKSFDRPATAARHALRRFAGAPMIAPPTP